MLGRKIEDPAKEVTTTRELEGVEVPDLDHAIAAAHPLLDKHADQVGEFALEIWISPPQLPYADQERLAIKDYKLASEARNRARAIGNAVATWRCGWRAWSGMRFPSSIAPPI